MNFKKRGKFLQNFAIQMMQIFANGTNLQRRFTLIPYKGSEAGIGYGVAIAKGMVLTNIYIL